MGPTEREALPKALAAEQVVAPVAPNKPTLLKGTPPEDSSVPNVEVPLTPKPAAVVKPVAAKKIQAAAAVTTTTAARPRSRKVWLAAVTGLLALTGLAVSVSRLGVRAPAATAAMSGAPGTLAKAIPNPLSTTPAILPAKAPDEGPAAIAAGALAEAPTAAALEHRARPSRAGTKNEVPDAPKLSLVDVPASPTKQDGDLGAAMKQATGARDPAAESMAAAPQTGAVSIRPPAGALNATIATAVREARACLGADDPIVHATLTFAADGSSTVRVGKVTSSVPGADACVTQALSRARVSPFVEAPLAVPVLVRP